MTSSIQIATLDGGAIPLAPEQLDALVSRIDGPLLRNGDDGWLDAVLAWNGMVATTPAIVIQPESARDVSEVIDFARRFRLLISVKGGGHNIAGTSLVEGGLTLDMSRMREITVEPIAKRARVGPGCLLKDVDAATQQYGLATVLGFISEVGVAGLTLGGGLGYLTRRFGWSVDNLEEVEIVTADGQIRTASRENEADLFWAVRGAGANVGIVTRFTFTLHDVGPTVYGGLIAWPAKRADEILAAYRSITTESPRELAVWLILLQAPPAPFVPVEWHGRKICAFAICYSGDMGQVDRVLAPVRSLGEPVMDLLEAQPYAQVQSYLDDTEPRGMHYYWKTGYLTELSDEFLATLKDAFLECTIPGAELGILHIGGSVNEHDEDDGAVGNRDARYVLGVNGMWEADEPDTPAFREWIRETWERHRAFSTGRTYINFQTADEGEDRVRSAYGTNFDRLCRHKAEYDPDNLFRANRNVRARG